MTDVQIVSYFSKHFQIVLILFKTILICTPFTIYNSFHDSNFIKSVVVFIVNMKLYTLDIGTINPFYTSLYLVIVFAVYVSSIELFVLDGKQYLNYKYEIIFGGPQVLMKIDGATLGGVKRVRTLTPDEILELREKRNKQKEIEKKQQEEEKEKKKQEEEERKRKSQTRQAEIEMGKKQRNEEQQVRTTQRIKEQQERDAKKAQREAESAQCKMETVKSNAEPQIRRTLNNKQNTPLNRLPRKKNVNA